jgi:hypothetical protein
MAISRRESEFDFSIAMDGVGLAPDDTLPGSLIDAIAKEKPRIAAGFS